MKILLCVFFGILYFSAFCKDLPSKDFFISKYITPKEKTELLKDLQENINYINENKLVFYKSILSNFHSDITNKIRKSIKNINQVKWPDIMFMEGIIFFTVKIKPNIKFHFAVHGIDFDKDILHYSYFVEKMTSKSNSITKYSIINEAQAERGPLKLLKQLKENVPYLSINTAFLTSVIGGAASALSATGVIGATTAAIATGIVPAAVLGSIGLAFAGYGLYKFYRRHKYKKCALSKYRHLLLQCQKSLRSLFSYGYYLLEKKKDKKDKHICTTPSLFDQKIHKLFFNAEKINCSRFKNKLQRYSEKGRKRKKKKFNRSINKNDIIDGFIFSENFELLPDNQIRNNYFMQNQKPNHNFSYKDQIISSSLGSLPKSYKKLKYLVQREKTRYEHEEIGNKGIYALNFKGQSKCENDHRHLPKKYSKQSKKSPTCSNTKDFKAVLYDPFHTNKNVDKSYLEGITPQEEICKHLYVNLIGCMKKFDSFLTQLKSCLPSNDEDEDEDENQKLINNLINSYVRIKKN